MILAPYLSTTLPKPIGFLLHHSRTIRSHTTNAHLHLKGCPSIMEDPTSVALELGPADGMGNGLCDERFGDDCTWFWGEGPTTFNTDDLGLPVNYRQDHSALDTDSRDVLGPPVTYEDYAPPDWTNLEAVAANNPKPTIYYDCASDYTSCIVYDRRRGPDFQRKLIVICSPDAFVSVGSQCFLCVEDGLECYPLTCDLALFPSEYNNWGQTWGSCRDRSCSCPNALETLENEFIA